MGNIRFPSKPVESSSHPFTLLNKTKLPPKCCFTTRPAYICSYEGFTCGQQNNIALEDNIFTNKNTTNYINVS